MSKDAKYVNSRVFVANLNSSELKNDEFVEVFKKYGKVVGECLEEKVKKKNQNEINL